MSMFDEGGYGRVRKLIAAAAAAAVIGGSLLSSVSAAGEYGEPQKIPNGSGYGAGEYDFDASTVAVPYDGSIYQYATGAGGEIVLAGFYSEPLSFSFPPAFMREARLRVAAEWQQSDLVAAKALIESGRLSLDGLITHHHNANVASGAYRVAFEDPACLKMVLDWRTCS